MNFVHFDEAKKAAEKQIQKWLNDTPHVEKALIVWDLLGKCRLALWAAPPIDTHSLEQILKAECQAWWSGDLFRIMEADKVTQLLYNETWEQARARNSKLAIVDRHRSRTMWFQNQDAPIWQAPDDGPPIIVFYSFKGGLGRSTILASFAIQRAIEGERVCVLDFDLDSPGVGNLMPTDQREYWGIVDFLLESDNESVPLHHYHHYYKLVEENRDIIIFPVGKVNTNYADKLARVDMETNSILSFEKLLRRIQEKLEPQWILIDARTGISASSGMLLSGIAHRHVIIGSESEQSWQGLNLVIERLGQQRLTKNRPQAGVNLVHGMAPADSAGKKVHSIFQDRADREFSTRYYAEPGQEDEDGQILTTRDIGSPNAPSEAIRVNYNSELASMRNIEDVTEALCAGPYATLAERIVEEFAKEEEES